MKKKPIYKWIIGIGLLPLAFIVFIFDRFILTFLPHLDSQNMKTWFNDTKLMIMSLIRISVILVCSILWYLIKIKING